MYEQWRYIDFQNGGRPPFWNVLPPYETTHEVSVALGIQAPVEMLL